MDKFRKIIKDSGILDVVNMPEVSCCYNQNLNVLVGTDTPAVSLMKDRNQTMSMVTRTSTLVSNEHTDSDYDSGY